MVLSLEERIFEILTRKNYNRDAPYLKDSLKERIHSFVAMNKPIKLVGFWGVGPKNNPNWADMASCEFLFNLNEEIKKIYHLGVEFIFIFATLHGVHNGIPIKTINSYTKKMEILFKKFGFKFVYLDTLWKKYGISFKKIDTLFLKKEDSWWSNVENAKMIEENAKNRNQRLNPKIAAQKYYIMRTLEKEMFEKEFSDSIFHAFSDSRLRNVLPDLPTLYLYGRKGWSNAPWFITE